MSPPPEWLPEMATVNPWTNETFDILYKVFEKDFKESKPLYQGKVVWFFQDMEDGREQIFWHMTSRKDDVTGERLPDLRRSERLPWARPMIDNANQPEILAWDYEEGDKAIKTYVWLPDFDFLVLMKRYPDGRRRLITSYYVDQPHTRRNLKKKYARGLK